MKKPAALIALTLPALGGLAALSWEVIWQLRTSLAFGVSASGAAITLATMMAGMTIGAAICGRWIDSRQNTHPLRLYGYLELVIGICGLALGATFQWLEQLDRAIYQWSPTMAPLAQLIGVVLVILVPAACMGASIPIFGRMGKRFGVSMSLLYGINTLGAAAGTLLVAFWLIPQFGLQGTAVVTALINCLVGLTAYFAANMGEQNVDVEANASVGDIAMPAWDVLAIVTATGFVTFLLEVAWFRALRAAFETTTTGFSIMLAVVLLTLGLAARAVPAVKARVKRLEMVLYGAGIAILLSTPLIERIDLVLLSLGSHHTPINWFAITLLLVGPAVFLLGIALPWHLEDGYSGRALGRIYAFNTIGSVFGAISAAWIFLPMFGFVHTAWIAGFVILAVTLLVYRTRMPVWSHAFAVASMVIAVALDSGVGSERILFSFPYGEHTVIAHHEGPDAATSAIEFENGSRGVFIDGFAAAAFWPTAHYMDWMGSLPVLLHEDPKDVLVICFGTGQTANAIRNEGVASTTIVDINPAVFQIAHHFPGNEGVLNDDSVEPVLMDGRAYLRRTKKMFDVITLEPMPPNHAGVNSLYSKEFYETARAKLRPGGMIAQWLPAHLTSEQHARSIAKTFQEVFPNAGLWADPADYNGILLGCNGEATPLGSRWPGLDNAGQGRVVLQRSLPPQEIRNNLLLDRDRLRLYTKDSLVVTDDNQLLAYGERLSMKEAGPRSTRVVYREFMNEELPQEQTPAEVSVSH
ncbi:Spermidine synthase [Rubripirellula lacrimiformis]|uniref:Spermidine synthase n=1 Tax=Rubripirellula lacrimiformis TaxID=1930273 RepID=A0A517NBU8_9BACT|nr:fused MFS/spermidine synthase [Rubripirellula lacrimiformis]QDT04610.1 Spermidine synthase [Rubripirellula lacrimiformis]